MTDTGMSVNGARGRYLLAWGVGYIGIGVSNVVAPTPARIEAFKWLPFWDDPTEWGWIWMAAGIAAVCTCFAYGHKSTNRADRWGFLALAAAPLVWVVVFGVSAMLDTTRSSIATIFIYMPLFLGQLAASGMENGVNLEAEQARRMEQYMNNEE